jgi:hypothetical protein
LCFCKRFRFRLLFFFGWDVRALPPSITPCHSRSVLSDMCAPAYLFLHVGVYAIWHLAIGDRRLFMGRYRAVILVQPKCVLMKAKRGRRVAPTCSTDLPLRFMSGLAAEPRRTANGSRKRIYAGPGSQRLLAILLDLSRSICRPSSSLVVYRPPFALRSFSGFHPPASPFRFITGCDFICRFSFGFGHLQWLHHRGDFFSSVLVPSSGFTTRDFISFSS